MEWYVYYENFNNNKIIEWNIFNHYRFKEDVDNLLKQGVKREEFEDRLKVLILYYFWGKTEYEIIISPWSGNAKPRKIDIFNQIKINFSRFADYVWSFSNNGSEMKI